MPPLRLQITRAILSCTHRERHATVVYRMGPGTVHLMFWLMDAIPEAPDMGSHREEDQQEAEVEEEEGGNPTGDGDVERQGALRQVRHAQAALTGRHLADE